MSITLEGILAKNKKYAYLGQPLSPKAAYLLLTDQVEVHIAQFCKDNSSVCDDALFWEALFADTYSDLYPPFKKISTPFVGKNPLVIMPSLYRAPVFWRDLYTDLENVRDRNDGGELLATVEELANSEPPTKEELVGELALSFWTLLVALENIEGAEMYLLPLILRKHSSFFEYVSARRKEDFLALSSLNGNAKIVTLLLKDKSVNPATKGSIALWNAISGGNEEVVWLLIADGRVNANAVLEDASRKGNLDVFRFVLEELGVDPSFNDNVAIQEAARGGHWHIVKLLIEDGRADPSANNSSALIYASIGGHFDVVQLLIEDGRADPSANNSSALFYASRGTYLEHHDIERILLEDGRSQPSAVKRKIP